MTRSLHLKKRNLKAGARVSVHLPIVFGGKLIFGVSNNSELVGLADAESDAEKISEAIKIHLNPIPEFRLSFEKDEDKTFVIVEVMKGQRHHTIMREIGNLSHYAYRKRSVPATPSSTKRTGSSWER